MDESSFVSGEDIMELIYALQCKCHEKEEKVRYCTDLSPVEYRVITSLTSEETITASQFAERVALSPSRISRVIEKMERNGYILVDRKSEDKRTVLLSLSSKAVEVKVTLAKEIKECHTKIESVLTFDERALLKKSVEKLLNRAL